MDRPDTFKNSESRSPLWDLPSPEDLERCFTDYSVESLISHDARCAVYRAVQHGLERTVAIRLLAPSSPDDRSPEPLNRDAIRAISALNHPGILTIHDFGSVDLPKVGTCLFVVTEFIVGERLSDRLEAGGFSTRVAFQLAKQLCDAVAHTHEQGCAPGNLSSECVWVTPTGRIKLDPIEWARSAPFRECRPAMAPEVRNGGEADARSEVYSLGAMTFELLTGAEPSVSGLSSLSRVDARLETIVRRAMEENPDLRYENADEVRSEIEAIDRSMTLRRRRKRKGLAVAAIVLGLAGLAFAFIRPEVGPWNEKPSAPVKADILVTTIEDGESIAGSLREAIGRAEDGDVIGFDVSLAGRTIRLLSYDGLTLEKSITIHAGNLDEPVTIDANVSKRVFRISMNQEVMLHNLRITGGNSELEGAGIRNLGGHLRLVNCAIVGNRTSSLRGGGLFNAERGTVILENCLVADNIAEQGAAGICNFGGETMILKNCVITGNECVKKSRHGCAVLNVNWSNLEMIHCTVVGNREVGIHSHESSNLLIENSIFAGNRGFGDADIYVRKRDGGGVETRGVNLVGNLDADVKSGDPPISADPMLEPLGGFGGWIRTMRPLPGSPVVDAALDSALVSDIRGLTRSIDGNGDGIARPDLGAVEFDPEGADR